MDVCKDMMGMKKNKKDDCSSPCSLEKFQNRFANTADFPYIDVLMAFVVVNVDRSKRSTNEKSALVFGDGVSILAGGPSLALSCSGFVRRRRISPIPTAFC